MLCKLHIYELEVTQLVVTAMSLGGSEKQLYIFHLHLPIVANSVNIDHLQVHLPQPGELIIYRISLLSYELGLLNSIYDDFSSSPCVASPAGKPTGEA